MQGQLTACPEECLTRPPDPLLVLPLPPPLLLLLLLLQPSLLIPCIPCIPADNSRTGSGQRRWRCSVARWRSWRRASAARASGWSIRSRRYKKFSIPFACFVLGLVAVPLGIQSRSAKRSFGVVLGLLFFLIYYVLMSVGLVLGETGACPPVIGMWGPNLVMGTIGMYLLLSSAKERPLKAISVLPRIFMSPKSVYPE